jgi:hypothetical protein
MKVKSMPAVRASISFLPARFETLEDIAKQKGVVGLVVRDAAYRYVTDRTLTSVKTH